MTFQASSSRYFSDIQSYYNGVMEASARRPNLRRPNLVKEQHSQGTINPRKSFPASYFSIESLLVLLFITVSLLILPLVLPPPAPPPALLLLVPTGILVVLLLVLAFIPSDVRNIASSYL